MHRLAGLDGVVCSPLEAGQHPRDLHRQDFLTVTPGIRFADAKADDQVRITTPAKAREPSARTTSSSAAPSRRRRIPVAAYRRCVSEFVG